MEKLYENGKVKIEARSLVMLIQAIDSEIKRLRKASPEDLLPEDYQLLEDYIDVAKELKEAYKEASKEILNMIPYDTLTNPK